MTDLDASLGPLSFASVEIQDHQLLPLTAQLAYRQKGSGPDIVLLHGIGANSAIYRKLVPLLTPQFRVTSVDWIGFGDSDKPINGTWYTYPAQSSVLTQLLNHISAERPTTVVASSMGGAIALFNQATTKTPFNLVALAPALISHRLPRALGWLAMLFATRFVSLILAMVLRWTPIGNLFFQWACREVVAFKTPVSTSMVELYSKPYLTGSIHDSAAALRSFFLSIRVLLDVRIYSALEAVNRGLSEKKDPRSPDQRNRTLALIVCGQDTLVPAPDLRSFLAQFAELNDCAEFQPHLGHHPMEDDPEFCRQLVFKMHQNALLEPKV